MILVPRTFLVLPTANCLLSYIVSVHTKCKKQWPMSSNFLTRRVDTPIVSTRVSYHKRVEHGHKYTQTIFYVIDLAFAVSEDLPTSVPRIGRGRGSMGFSKCRVCGGRGSFEFSGLQGRADLSSQPIAIGNRWTYYMGARNAVELTRGNT